METKPKTVFFSEISRPGFNSSKSYLQIAPLNHFRDHVFCLLLVTALFLLFDDILDEVHHHREVLHVAMQQHLALGFPNGDVHLLGLSSVTDGLNLVGQGEDKGGNNSTQICTYTQTHTQFHTDMHARMRAHTHTHINTHADTHTQTSRERE